MKLSWLPTALRVKSKLQNSLQGPTPTGPTCFPSITSASFTLSLAQTLWSPLRSSVPRISVFTTSLCTCPSFLVEHNSHLHRLCSTLAPCMCLIPIHFSTGRRETQTTSPEICRISEHEEVLQKGNKTVFFKCLHLKNWFI